MINLIVFMGEAGSGKDRMLNEILASTPNTHRVIGYTTRKPREHEVDGVNYYFLDMMSFYELTRENSMYEYSKHVWYYGTGIKSYNENKINIAVLNPTGISKLINNPNFNVKVYWVRAAAKTRLIRQLSREDDPDVDEIIRRFGTDTSDFKDIKFDYIDLSNENEDDLRAAIRSVQKDIRELETAPPHNL